MKDKDQQAAIFWCSLLRPILYGEVEEKNRHCCLRQLSEEAIRFPGGAWKKPSLSTLRRKLRQYQHKGFESLARKPRSDRGIPRKISSAVINAAVDIKRDQAKRSARTINLFLEDKHRITVPHSTLYRHLKHHGATRLKLGVVRKKVRCRWTREQPNDLWVGDFSNGPYVLFEENKVEQTYLSLFIDCHSRFVVEGRYYLRQSLDILVDSLLRAWTVHGLPNDLYLDNAKVYRSNALKAASFKLHFKILHRKAGDPAPGGLVERLFGTNQEQFETEVRAGDILSLDQLNRAFQAWLHHYHHSVHSEIKRTPQELYQGAIKRAVDIDSVMQFFMEKKIRIVHQDFSDISLNGHFYSVDTKLRGDKVFVHYYPFGPIDKVLIYSLEDKFETVATLYNRELKEQPIPPPPQQKKPRYNYIELITRNHEQHLQKRVQGINFAKLSLNGRWPFSALLQTLAMLIGKKEGASAFSSSELETLKKLYDRYPELNKVLLTEAFEQAEVKNIAHLVLQLQQLKNTKP